MPKRKCFLNSVSSEEVWKNCSLDEIEKAFCHELLKSYEKVGKALSAGDPSESGYISLNYLKFVLDTFVYRLPRRIFIRLMERLGLKTTTKVKWKQFLTSLYEPQWLEVNNKIPLTKRNRQEKSVVMPVHIPALSQHCSCSKLLPKSPPWQCWRSSGNQVHMFTGAQTPGFHRFTCFLAVVHHL